MKVNDLLSELRRNPTVNVKQGFHQEAVKFLKSKGKDVRNYGVSMTSVHKLGVNPNSRYNTPVGIYFYPAEYYMRVKENLLKPGKLPFQDNAPHIQIFEMKGNVVDISNTQVKEFDSYISMLYKNVGRISQLIGLSENSTQKSISHAVMNSHSMAKIDTYGGSLWYVFYALSNINGTNKRDTAAPRSSVIWNSILRLLDIDILIDEGAGIIHENEPYQGVVLNPRSVKLVHTVTNHKELAQAEIDQKAEAGESEKEKAEINSAKVYNTLTSGNQLYYFKFYYNNGTAKSGKFYGKNYDSAHNAAAATFSVDNIEKIAVKPLN